MKGAAAVVLSVVAFDSRTTWGLAPGAVECLLTGAGGGVRNVLEQFGAWGIRWAFGAPRPDELDPVLLLWEVH